MYYSNHFTNLKLKSKNIFVLLVFFTAGTILNDTIYILNFIINIKKQLKEIIILIWINYELRSYNNDYLSKSSNN